MIHNAVVTRIDKYLGPDVNGDPTYENGPTISLSGTLIRVGVLFQDSASANQQAFPNVGRLIVQASDLSGPDAAVMNDRVTVVPEGREKRRYIVNYAWDRMGTERSSGYIELDLRDEDQAAKLPGGS